MAKAKKPRGPSARVKAELAKLPKMSETILEFAKPLLDLTPTKPPTLEDMKTAVMLANMAWNYPIQGDPRRKDVGAAKLRRLVEEWRDTAAPEVRRLMDDLMHVRVTKFAHDPRIAIVEVIEAAPDEVRISATAALLPDLP